MILHRLYELAEREKLLDDLAFQDQPISFIVPLDEKGYYAPNTLADNRILVEPKKPGGSVKPGKGGLLSVPRPLGRPNAKGFACYFADTLERVLPVSKEPKSLASRSTFWEQVDRASRELDDPALLAVHRFGQRLREDAALETQIRLDVERWKPKPGDRCTFRLIDDGELTLVQKPAIREWFARLHQSYLQEQQGSGPSGLCQITGAVGPIPSSHPTKVKMAGGLPTGVSLVSADKQAFQSYGLHGTSNAAIGYRAAEGYSRAVNTLVNDRLKGARSKLLVGGVTVLFWTRAAAGFDLAAMFEPDDDPAALEAMLESPCTARSTAVDVASDSFYCLMMSPNAARVMVRDYLEVPLSRVAENLRNWFTDLRTFDVWRDTIRATFKLRALAYATVRDPDDLRDEIPVLLLRTALLGDPVPDGVLVSLLRRLRVDPSQGFTLPRMALLRLTLNRHSKRKGTTMPEALDASLSEVSPGYACGRLLAFLARCQSAAQGRRNFGEDAQLLQRFFGAASTAPRSVFGLLLRLNRHHLDKVRGEHVGFATNLEKELEQHLGSFPSATGTHDFPAVLSLVEQGRFAMGFYHQRAEYRRLSAEGKAEQQSRNETTPRPEVT